MKHQPVKLCLISMAMLFSLLAAQAAPRAALASRPGDDPGPIAKQKRTAETAQHPGAAPAAGQSTGGPDAYGYTWVDTGPYAWIPVDASDPTWINLNFQADDTSSLVPSIGIAGGFPFYENIYNQVYVSTNGLLTFSEEGAADYYNEPIPFQKAPNNFIAPFWDDLNVGEANPGKVFYHAASDKLVIVYQNVIRNTAPVSDTLTFEAILYKSGNICFQYQDLNGTLDAATVGIEDPDGVDGLQYLYKAPGLLSLQGVRSLCFTRPTPRGDVKMLPLYSGGTTVEGLSRFNIDLHNIGGLGPDTFDFTIQKSNPAWTVKLYDQSGFVQLKDTNGSGGPDTGVVPAGGTFKFIVQVTAPDNAPVGSNATITLTAASSLIPGNARQVKLQSAVPSPFAQLLDDSDTGIEFHQIWAHSQHNTFISTQFKGSVLAVVGKYNGSDTVAWECNQTKIIEKKPYYYTNLGVSRVDKFGKLSQSSGFLVDHVEDISADSQTSDRTPAMAVAPDGKVGIVWVRDIISSTLVGGLPVQKINSNVYFAILDSGAVPAITYGPENVTQNALYRGSGDTNLPFFRTPQIAATEDGRFALAWVDNRLPSVDAEDNEIWLAVYQGSAGLQTAPKQITSGAAGSVWYLEPTLTALTGSRLFLVYAKHDINSNPLGIYAQVFDSAASLSSGQMTLAGVSGHLPTASQQGAGNILLAWTAGDNQIQYAVLNSVSYVLQKGPFSLATPDGLYANYVSITLDADSRAILTWQDVDLGTQLYYALVDQTGNLATPPLGYYRVRLVANLTVSHSGFSLAPYVGVYRVNLPALMRH
jgi:hypothetical protein